jgi:hypothetical protein
LTVNSQQSTVDCWQRGSHFSAHLTFFFGAPKTSCKVSPVAWYYPALGFTTRLVSSRVGCYHALGFTVNVVLPAAWFHLALGTTSRLVSPCAWFHLARCGTVRLVSPSVARRVAQGFTPRLALPRAWFRQPLGFTGRLVIPRAWFAGKNQKQVNPHPPYLAAPLLGGRKKTLAGWSVLGQARSYAQVWVACHLLLEHAS